MTFLATSIAGLLTTTSAAADFVMTEAVSLTMCIALVGSLNSQLKTHDIGLSETDTIELHQQLVKAWSVHFGESTFETEEESNIALARAAGGDTAKRLFAKYVGGPLEGDLRTVVKSSAEHCEFVLKKLNVDEERDE